MSVTSIILQYANLSFIPEQYRWLVPIGLIVLGILMMFRSRDTWKFLIAAIGALGSYYAVEHYGAKYYTSILVAHSIPLYIPPLIAAVIGSIILIVLVRFAISGAIGYASFMYLGLHYQLDIAITIAIVIAAVAYYLYNKIVVILAKFIGAFMLFFGLVLYHVPDSRAALIMAAVLLIAMIWLIGRKKIIAAYTAWKTRRKDKTPKVKTPKVKKQKDPNTAKGVKIKMKIQKVFGTAKKLIPHRKKEEAQTAASEEPAKEAEQSTPQMQTVTHVRSDGTIITEEVVKK